MRGGFLRTGGLVMGCVLFLAACGTTESRDTNLSARPDPIAKTGGADAAAGSAKADRKGRDSVSALPKEGRGVTKRLGSMRLPKIKSLMGKSGADIVTLLGEPRLKRQDAPAEIWQYLTSECALHLIFYPKGGSKAGGKAGSLVVQHISVNDRETVKQINADQCFGSQLEQAEKPEKDALS
ncbi:hypothetical protein [Sneathiella chinensis]|uniref:Lipoprotein SmpA/OmlA domain-containing protein n=1 Tax=Sneathiella chinensis TaxID=349750 RepID=A0ABQ5U258_9PROT|nr:hypothetical protein [Sneathiella chinensis]GLQ05260.1 hypothetical protein GCM10007924_04810 [Sneathiella chinensis]